MMPRMHEWFCVFLCVLWVKKLLAIFSLKTHQPLIRSFLLNLLISRVLILYDWGLIILVFRDDKVSDGSLFGGLIYTQTFRTS